MFFFISLLLLLATVNSFVSSTPSSAHLKLNQIISTSLAPQTDVTTSQFNDTRFYRLLTYEPNQNQSQSQSQSQQFGFLISSNSTTSGVQKLRYFVSSRTPPNTPFDPQRVKYSLIPKEPAATNSTISTSSQILSLWDLNNLICDRSDAVDKIQQPNSHSFFRKKYSSMIASYARRYAQIVNDHKNLTENALILDFLNENFESEVSERSEAKRPQKGADHAVC